MLHRWKSLGIEHYTNHTHIKLIILHVYRKIDQVIQEYLSVAFLYVLSILYYLGHEQQRC